MGAQGVCRYLSPEPMLQSPNWVKGEALDGQAVPVYAYGANNPIRNTDPTGLRNACRDLPQYNSP